jgi:hypothetical protein
MESVTLNLAPKMAGISSLRGHAVQHSTSRNPPSRTTPPPDDASSRSQSLGLLSPGAPSFGAPTVPHVAAAAAAVALELSAVRASSRIKGRGESKPTAARAHFEDLSEGGISIGGRCNYCSTIVKSKSMSGSLCSKDIFEQCRGPPPLSLRSSIWQSSRFCQGRLPCPTDLAADWHVYL